MSSARIERALENDIRDHVKHLDEAMGSDSFHNLYAQAHELFNTPDYSAVSYDSLRHDHLLYQKLDAIRKHNVTTMERLTERHLVVSLTTYPKRIGHLRRMLDSILKQTRKADRIVVQLTEGEFPNHDADLPDNVRELVDQKLIETRYCKENLRPHLKYFYTMQEFPDDVVVTVDDDIIYQPRVLDHLWWSYLQFPKAVSSMRAHLIALSDNLEPLPYASWPMEVETNQFVPSMDLLATGVGGVAYPPDVLPKETFDVEAIKLTCLAADDLWLKAMELMGRTPVVVCSPYVELTYVPGTQDVGLYHGNLTGTGNDTQLEAIIRLLGERHGTEWFKSRMLNAREGREPIHDLQEFASFTTRNANQTKGRIRREREAARREVAKLRSENASLRDEIKRIRLSKAFRLGTAIAMPYRMLHDAFKRD